MALFSIEQVSKYFSLQEGMTGWTGRRESFVSSARSICASTEVNSLR